MMLSLGALALFLSCAHATLFPSQNCKEAIPEAANPPSVNLWTPLTVEETTSIEGWLQDPARNLNLTKAQQATLSDDTIFLIEAYPPRKADALAHLASPSTVSPPERFARVSLHHGAADPPSVKDYLLGPLPIGDKTNLRHLTDIYHAGIPYNSRGFISILPELFAMFQQVYSPEFLAAIEELFNGTFRGTPEDTILPGTGAPFSFDGSFRRLWIFLSQSVPGSWLHPLGFFNYIDMSGTDPTKWKILKTVYNDVIYDSTDEFIAAVRNGTVHAIGVPDRQSDWSSRQRVPVDRDLDERPGPRSVSFAGLRFRVDRDKQYVSWMSWGLYLSFNRDTGLSLWDIRFKNERLIYELSLQDALTHYAGRDPSQSSSALLDRYLGMGSYVRDLIPGYDCPAEAVYLPATTYAAMGSIHLDRATCIFELDTAKPISRHMGVDSPGETGAVKGYVLTIRSISTVENYDYMFDYNFYLDGSIEVKVSASGYLLGGYWTSEKNNYGSRIHDFAMGTVHDHVMNFKIDLDVAGQNNSFLKSVTSQEEIKVPWADQDWGPTVIQQRIDRSFIKNENDARIQYAPNGQSFYSIVNQDATNAWGNTRGYTLIPGISPVHDTVVGTKRLLKNANWARYNFAVSKRKETEPSSSSMWNQNLPGAPPVNFDKFFDGESITQDDLVMWVNVGMHHLPVAEDVPNTKTNVATSSFMLSPTNYFDFDPSLESRNAVFMSPSTQDPTAPFTFDIFGVDQSFTCIPAIPAPFEYETQWHRA